MARSTLEFFCRSNANEPEEWALGEDGDPSEAALALVNALKAYDAFQELNLPMGRPIKVTVEKVTD